MFTIVTPRTSRGNGTPNFRITESTMDFKVNLFRQSRLTTCQCHKTGFFKFFDEQHKNQNERHCEIQPHLGFCKVTKFISSLSYLALADLFSFPYFSLLISKEYWYPFIRQNCPNIHACCCLPNCLVFCVRYRSIYTRHKSCT